MSIEKIKKLMTVGFFGPLDVQMAGLVSRMQPEANENLLVASALASRAIDQGHACVDLVEYAGRQWSEILENSRLTSRENEVPDEEHHQELADIRNGWEPLPELEKWKESLKPPIVANGVETKENKTLFVLQDSRLYLRRYWDYERRVENALHRRNVPSGKQAAEEILKRHFGPATEQKEAAKKAIRNRLSILSGGPGTGKTYTLARAVALLAEMNLGHAGEFNVRMVAPTGKAAMRMAESIRQAKAMLQKEGMDTALLNAIPHEASTIHRLLGARHHSPYFAHDANNPLTADMVIVDEASMVDLPLMAKLLDALPGKCALMLVGDIDQLASVEPGRVYGDVCRAAGDNGPLAGCLTCLTKSWRFPEGSAIGHIARLINQGRAEAAWKTLQASKDTPHLRVLDSSALLDPDGIFRGLVEQNMTTFLKARKPEDVLEAANNFRILCALREGPYGVKRMNRQVEKILSEKGLAPGGPFYDHQLITIMVNTPTLHLYNGDIGVVLAREGNDRTKEYVAWFHDENKDAHPVPVNLLPAHETAFAMTVHKSQGSEFPCVALILPDSEDSPVLARELLYTGMTRVRIDEKDRTGKLVMWCTEAGFKKAAATKTTRTTGLFAE